jgi:predicted nucleotidyltransferase
MLSESYILQISSFFSEKPVKRTFVFGSFARNEANEKSDIDILVEIDYKKQNVSLLDFIGWKLDLEKIVKRQVDLVSSDGLSKYMKPIIEKEKILIYEKAD